MVKNASEIKQQCLSKWSAGLEFDDCLSKFNVSFFSREKIFLKNDM